MPRRCLLWLAAGLLALPGAVLANGAGVAPHNNLERALRAVQAGDKPLPQFLDVLVGAEVILLSKREVVGARTPADIPALVLPGSDGESRHLAVFTSPELARQVAETYPEYRFGVETDFLWVLAHAAPGLGVAINPGWTLGLEIPSYGLLQLRDKYRARIDARLNR